MRRLRVFGFAVGLLLAAGKSRTTGAQVTNRPPPAAKPRRDEIHPELVDSTWGPRTAAAWQLAFAHHWEDARARFTELHAVHPFGLESVLGLAFVARATGRRAEAEQYLRQAFALEPTDDIRRQIDAVEWDKTGSLALSGEAAHIGTRTTTDWSLDAVVPLTQQVSLTGRAGVLGAGDPLRGVFIDSTGGADARVISAGAVARPIESLALTTRVEYWTSGNQNQTFFWLDGTQRLTDNFAIRLGARPVGGATGGPQFSGGADIIFVPGQSLALDVIQGARAAPFEARTQLRAFYYGTVAMRHVVRLGLLRDTGPANQATTGFAVYSLFFNPNFGIQLQASDRRGAFARTTAGGGLVVRW